MSIKSFWEKNRDDLGKEIFQSLVFKLFGLVEVAWIAIRAIYAFSSPRMTLQEGLWFWGITVGFALIAFVLACLLFYFLFVKDHEAKHIPAPEAFFFDTGGGFAPPPLSIEAQHILALVVKHEHLSLYGLAAFGMKGTMYQSGNATLCDGMDAKQSARYEAATRELASRGYLNRHSEGVFSLTAEGIDAAEKLPPQEYPTKYDADEKPAPLPTPPVSTVASLPYLDIRLKVQYADDENGQSKPYLVADISSPLADAEVRDVFLDIPHHEAVRPGWAILPFQGFDPGKNLTCTLRRNTTLTVFFARRIPNPTNPTEGKMLPPADYYHTPWGQVDEARCVVVRCLGLPPQESIANVPLKELKDWVANDKQRGDPRFRDRDGKGGFRSGGSFKPYH